MSYPYSPELFGADPEQVNRTLDAFNERAVEIVLFHERLKLAKSMPIEECDLGTRVVRLLHSHRIRTLGGLARRKQSTMLKWRGFGGKTLTDLDLLLDKHGLDWRSERARR